MLKKAGIFAVALLLALPLAANAQFQMGDREFSLSGTGSSDNDFDTTNFNLQFSVGYFFSEVLEGLIRQDVEISARDNAKDNWGGSTALVVDFYMPFLEVWNPFIGAALGYSYGDDREETFFAGPEIGLKWFANTTTFIQGLVQYQWLFDDGNDIDNNFNDGRFLYGLGIGFIF